ncbi:hypothetical protein PR202_gb21883 [Eleusine coracana subsp. coracana]|uniref:Uncharacterized protein n=1 Tax=Eleusine coracana subsp. coracana TaxID=191504 RepID=A0AAV5FGB3_ELECO|nr:hypothetical protein PR202_gb21883 [Eleusine coracana subsp. coracana]
MGTSCIVNTEVRQRIFGKRSNPSWKVAEFTNCKECQLKEVQVAGFCPMEQQMTLIKAVMERAPNLRKLVLKDFPACEACQEIGSLPRSKRLPAERVFPEAKDEQDMVVKRLMGDMAYSHRVISIVCLPRHRLLRRARQRQPVPPPTVTSQPRLRGPSWAVQFGRRDATFRNSLPGLALALALVAAFVVKGLGTPAPTGYSITGHPNAGGGTTS